MGKPQVIPTCYAVGIFNLRWGAESGVLPLFLDSDQEILDSLPVFWDYSAYRNTPDHFAGKTATCNLTSKKISKNLTGKIPFIFLTGKNVVGRGKRPDGRAGAARAVAWYRVAGGWWMAERMPKLNTVWNRKTILRRDAEAQRFWLEPENACRGWVFVVVVVFVVAIGK